MFRLLTVHHAYCKQNTLKHVAFNYSDTNATYSKYSNTNTSQCQTYSLFRTHILSQIESKTRMKTLDQDLTPQHRIRNRCRGPRFGTNLPNLGGNGSGPGFPVVTNIISVSNR